MKPPMLLGAVLIGVGVLMLIFQAITYRTHRQPVKAAAEEAAVEKPEVLPVAQIVGALTLGGGIFIFVLGSNKKV